MRTLVRLSLEDAYRTCSHRLGHDFLANLLSSSTFYRRATGFFASSVFSVAPTAWLNFFECQGKVRVVTSPNLSANDIAAIERAVVQRASVRKKFALSSFSKHSILEQQGCEDFFSCLLATDLLEIKIAVLSRRSANEIYHEKIGIFSDSDLNLVTFTGSANETRSAYSANFERVDVFSTFGTKDGQRRSYSIERQFEDLWNNSTDGVHVFRLHEALRENIFFPPDYSQDPGERQHQSPQKAYVPSSARIQEVLVPALEYSPREHQRLAIREWAKAGGKGLLEMATGSGKTITALTLASRLYDAQGGSLAILIVAPLVHLLDQWREVAGCFGLDPIVCAIKTEKWYSELNAGIDSLLNGNRNVLSMVSTGATLQSAAFQRLISRIHCPFLLIADEVHNYGASESFAALPDNATLRVGLSATPDRAYDTTGNQRIQEYFGKTVYVYDLEEALRDGILTPYLYYPTTVTFNDEEVAEYLRLSEQIAKCGIQQDEDVPASEAAKRLLIRRARLIATASGKLAGLRRLLVERKKEQHILVYCGDGSIEDEDSGEVVRQVDAAVRIIGADLGMRCARYTAETPRRKRTELLEQFTRGEIQVLVAIRCLDEGVDIPATREAFILASSTNPRQFVQRRGRVLRKAAGKRRAIIHDFFVVFSPTDYDENHPQFQTARSLLRNQLKRVQEFASLAENGPSARNALLNLRMHFNLLSEG